VVRFEVDVFRRRPFCLNFSLLAKSHFIILGGAGYFEVHEPHGLSFIPDSCIHCPGHSSAFSNKHAESDGVTNFQGMPIYSYEIQRLGAEISIKPECIDIHIGNWKMPHFKLSGIRRVIE